MTEFEFNTIPVDVGNENFRTFIAGVTAMELSSHETGFIEVVWAEPLVYGNTVHKVRGLCTGFIATGECVKGMWHLDHKKDVKKGDLITEMTWKVHYALVKCSFEEMDTVLRFAQKYGNGYAIDKVYYYYHLESQPTVKFIPPQEKQDSGDKQLGGVMMTDQIKRKMRTEIQQQTTKRVDDKDVLAVVKELDTLAPPTPWVLITDEDKERTLRELEIKAGTIINIAGDEIAPQEAAQLESTVRKAGQDIPVEDELNEEKKRKGLDEKKKFENWKKKNEMEEK